MARYKEREEWYETYLDDYTMTVLNEDLFRSQDLSSLACSVAVVGLDDDNLHDKKGPSKVSESKNEATEKENGDINCATGPKEENVRRDPIVVGGDATSTTTGGGEERDAPLFLQLQVKKQGDDQQTCRRIVDAQCGICFTNAQEGDEIVWSGLQCRHVYHRNCILPWLSSGKKRCPLCQHWFVPSELIWKQKWTRERMVAHVTAPREDDSAPRNTGFSVSSSCSDIGFPFYPPGVRISLTTISGSVRNRFTAKITPLAGPNEQKDYVLVRGERFFFYPPGTWATRRYNSNGYSFAYACVTDKGLIFAPSEGQRVLEY